MKSCIKCLATKSVLLFPKKRNVCKECWAAYDKAYRDEHINRIARGTYDKAYYKANKEQIAANQRKRYIDNSAKTKAKNRASYLRNIDKNLNTKKEYMKNNKGLVNAIKAKRRAAKLQRTPSWTTETDIWMMKEIYNLAALRTKLTGVKCHVDHIIPLQGKLVSGLHTPYNMQVIPAAQNISKGNKFEL